MDGTFHPFLMSVPSKERYFRGPTTDVLCYSTCSTRGKPEEARVPLERDRLADLKLLERRRQRIY